MTFSFPDTKFYREAADKLKDFMADHDSENEPSELKLWKRFNFISLRYGKRNREMNLYYSRLGLGLVDMLKELQTEPIIVTIINYKP